MRMGVWEIMEIDKSLRVMEQLRLHRLQGQTRKSIDPQLDRSLPNNDFIAEREKSQIDNRDPITSPCRDCPEGMQW